MEISSELSTFSILLIGFVLGLRHATEADHLAAVSTIVSEKKSLFTASIVGGLWGVGHTISLFLVGLLVIFLKLQISESVETKLEAVVGVMLVLLGLFEDRQIDQFVDECLTLFFVQRLVAARSRSRPTRRPSPCRPYAGARSRRTRRTAR